jgi:Flp pilus assembly protein TadD
MRATLLCALVGLIPPVAVATDAAAPIRNPQAAPPPRILVVPFETPGRDGRTYWLGEAAAILIADDVNARGLGAITRPARDRAYDQLHLPPNALLSRATVIKVGEIVGAGQIVVGEVTVDGDALTVKARPIRIDVGRAESEVVERGSLADLFGIVRKVARRVVPGGSETAAPAAPLSLQSFEQYVKGLLAEQPASQAEFLEAALKLDPAYDRARLALWEVRAAQGDHAAALAVTRGIGADSTYARRARFLSGVSLMALKQYDEAFTVFRTLQDSAPDAAILNNLGVIQLRRPASPDAGKPVYYFTKAAEAAPDDPDLLFNVGYAYAVDKDPQGAIYWLREALRRNPADGDAHVVLAYALDAAGVPSKPRVSASSRRSCHRGRRMPGVTHSRAVSSVSGTTWVSSGGTASIRRLPIRRSATSAIWRSSTSNAAAVCSKASRIAKRWPSCGGPSSCRPTKRRRTCSSAAFTCAAAARPRRSVRSRSRSGAAIAPRRTSPSRMPTCG